MKAPVLEKSRSESRNFEERITGLCITCANAEKCIFRKGIANRIVFCEEYTLDYKREPAVFM